MTTQERSIKTKRIEFGSDEYLNMLLSKYHLNFVQGKDKQDILSYSRDLIKICQDLNNAERESLLAENAMMRESIEEAIEFGTEKPLHDALSAKQRLGEVYVVKLVGVNFMIISENHKLKTGDKVYTIQKGE